MTLTSQIQLREGPRSPSPVNGPWLSAQTRQRALAPTSAHPLQLGGHPEPASSATAARQSQYPGEELLPGTSCPLCPQVYPCSISGPQGKPRRTWGPRRPCPRTGSRWPGSLNSWAAGGPHWDSGSETTALPSPQSTGRHWLREGVRGRFSGSCTSRPEGEGSAQTHSPRSSQHLRRPPRALHLLPLPPPLAARLSSPCLPPAALATLPVLELARPLLQLFPLPEMLVPRHVDRKISHLLVFAPTSPPLSGPP